MVLMSRKFTKREKILLAVFVLLFAAILYYKFVWLDTTEAIAQYSTQDLEIDLQAEQQKAATLKKMKKDMENVSKKNLGTVANYNNIQNEIQTLNDCLSASDTFSLDFGEANLTDTTVRRDITLSFHARDYEAAKSIIESLHNCQYRCLIKAVTLTQASESSSNGGGYDASLTITFYETTYQSTTTSGLVKSSDGTASSDTATSDTAESN